jgi:plasmid maintenance system antidote protein VapI
MSKSHKGIPLSQKHRRRIGEAQEGSKSHLAKLTEAMVLDIKRGLLNGEVQQRLAEKFGVTSADISDIRSGKTWLHVLPGKKLPPGNVLGSRHWNSKLTEKDVQKIKKDTEKSITQLAKDYGVNFMTISDIVKGRTWSHVKG